MRISQSEALLKSWLVKFGPAVADAQTQLTAEQLYSLSMARCWCLKAAGVGDVMPVVCFCVMPSLSHTFRRVVLKGEGLNAKQVGNPMAVRGALALMLRSLNSSNRAKNYLSLYADPKLKVDIV